MLLTALFLCAPAPMLLQTAASCPYTRIQSAVTSYGDHFGALDVEGDTLLAGAWHAKVGTQLGAGMAYIFLRDDNGTPTDRRDDRWLETHEFRAGIWSTSFGVSGTLQGKLAIVGAIRASQNNQPGSVYTFGRRDGGTPLDPLDDAWDLLLEIPSPSSTADWFGAGIEFEGDTLIVTARFDDGIAANTGAFYHYERADNGTPDDPFDDSWTLVAKVTASDASQSSGFGLAMAWEGDLLLMGAAGKVYTFQRDRAGTTDPLDDTWVELGILSTNEPTSDSFGRSFALSGEHLSVGAYRAAVAGSVQGKVYSFIRDDAGTPADPFDDTWSPTSSLAASDGIEDDYFGLALDLDGDLLAVGAERHEGLGGHPRADVGAVYFYQRDDQNTADPLDDVYVELEKLMPVDGLRSEHFGSATHSHGSELWLGSGGLDGGAVYVIDRERPCPGSLGTRLGTGANPLRLSGAGAPLVGGIFEARVDTTGHAGVLVTAIEAWDRPYVGYLTIAGGEILVDVLTGARLGGQAMPSSSSGVDVFSFPVPSDSNLVGTQVFFQALTFGGASGLELTNGLNTTLGML